MAKINYKSFTLDSDKQESGDKKYAKLLKAFREEHAEHVILKVSINALVEGEKVGGEELVSFEEPKSMGKVKEAYESALKADEAWAGAKKLKLVWEVENDPTEQNDSDEEEPSDDDSSEEQEEAPKKPGKATAKKVAKDEESSDDEPKAKKASGAKPKAKKGEDDEEQTEEKPKKGSKAANDDHVKAVLKALKALEQTDDNFDTVMYNSNWPGLIDEEKLNAATVQAIADSKAYTVLVSKFASVRSKKLVECVGGFMPKACAAVSGALVALLERACTLREAEELDIDQLVEGLNGLCEVESE